MRYVQRIGKRRLGLLLAVLVVGLLSSLAIPSVRDAVRPLVPPLWLVHVQGIRYGFSIDHNVRISAPDGIQLAASLYKPRASSTKFGTILVRVPYGRLKHIEGLGVAAYFARRGFAVLVTDVRGKFDSGGLFAPYQHAIQDGVATLDWIVKQSWSNGRVGTYGCSALGELQHILAKARHPAHRAMVPQGAGGAVGALGGRHTYFGIFEGGVFQLAGGFGWFLMNGSYDSKQVVPASVDIAAAVRTLPLGEMMQRVHAGTNSFDDFVSRPFSDPWWSSLEYIADSDRFETPALVINTWGDQTVGDTLFLAESIRTRMPPHLAKHQHVVIAPGNHCQQSETAESGIFGDIEVRNAEQPYFEWYQRWFEYWLYDRGNALNELPAYLYYMLGEHRWLSAQRWPPENTQPQRFYLTSDGRANNRSGDGLLAASPQSTASYDEFRYDPANPAPSRGGPVCCTGNKEDRSGPVDQSDVEQREDVLVYTSAPLTVPLRIAGPLSARLIVSSSAVDTDFIARLVHVRPNGLATNIQEGALRVRYRNGFEHPTLLTPGLPVEISIDMRSIAYSLPAGHRLRLHVTSSSFPRLARNLNTGNRIADEAIGVVATNRVFHDAHRQSFLEVAVLPP